ncbi:MAG: glycoside hydrolase family 3 C-terminal domain-containing protein [Bacteroidota bacterium]
MRRNFILFGILTFFIVSATYGRDKNLLPYQNTNLPIEERVNDLVTRMTLDEKISQMMNSSVAIERLGIPAYNWWNEGLHGVGRADIATVFPQAIGMGATFNDSLLLIEAAAISDEFRAKYNEYQRQNDKGQYKGLTVWSPNINIFRDPRWGRGQETYGEDPWLTSRMGVAFVKGLQGNDPVYLKTVATPKHFVVHSGPESTRAAFNVNVSDRDFYETYTRAFEACIKEGKAYSIMAAYNRYRGKACSGSDTLLTDILRKQWGFTGYVVSDCGAIANIYAAHKIVKTPAEAAAIGVKAGCDLECGETYSHLKEAVEKGYITEKEIDIAVKRLFVARFKLGMFDPQNKVPYNNIPLAVNDSKEHRDLSLITALQSLVLLKNSNNVLPLNKDLSAIAVFGPNANERDVMYGNYNGFPSKSVTILEGIKSMVNPTTKVYYNQATYLAGNEPYTNLVADYFEDGLTAQFYNNDSLSGLPVGTEKYDNIYFKWETGPVKGLVRDHYSVRWTGILIAPVTGNFEFLMTGDDGYRFYLDDKNLIDAWGKKNLSSQTCKINLKAGQKYKFRVELYNSMYNAFASVRWIVPGVDATDQMLDMAKKADVSIFVGGLSPSLEGEAMDVNYDGFFGGDRTGIDLPVCQLNFLKQLVKIGKPVVLVLLNGSALAINWESQNIPAILEAWYPGQEGGTAVAKALFGDYNPAGRLPVTFYKSVKDIPAFDSYDMEGRTYRYFRGEPLFPFGYGLSYSTFEYANLKLSSSIIGKDDILTVTLDVKNSGTKNGDEVVQMYIKDLEASTPRPIKELNGFSRISLKAGEIETVKFILKPSQLQLINNKGERVIEPGGFEILIGSSSDDIRLKKMFTYK